MNEPIIIDSIPLPDAALRTSGRKWISREDAQDYTNRWNAMWDELKLIITTQGPFNINVTGLGKKHGLSYEAVRRAKEKAIQLTPVDGVKVSAIDAQAKIKLILKQQGDFLLDPAVSKKEKREASDLVLRAIDAHTKFLEAYGFKEIYAKNQFNTAIQVNNPVVNQIAPFEIEKVLKRLKDEVDAEIVAEDIKPQ